MLWKIELILYLTIGYYYIQHIGQSTGTMKSSADEQGVVEFAL
jgi:hypothetical protein